jgi:Tol biopolymer transport system component/tRNA A-37 threonylcarbamoyl transferase component Bud32
MSLEPGERVGRYEIVARTGAGAMGEVYRARDSRLDRTVAIKVMAADLARDDEARARFEQEARAIAALNDSNICTIHDVGRHGDADYLVLEYLEGESLAQRLERPPVLALGEALAIAIQIGRGLDRAHHAGIAHRDLKPGNVMLVPKPAAPGSCDVKLMDFGLASRTATSRRAPAGPALNETISASIAETRGSGGVSVSGLSGTLQYISPEQLSGSEGDERADIFAFGCVLYEMLAGRRAFEGTTALTVLAAIASSEPRPIEGIAEAHPLLDHVLRRCLEKDRERRWQSIRDAIGELEWIADRLAAAPVVAPLPPPARSRARWRFGVPAALVLAGAAALGMWARGTPAPVDLPVMTFTVTTAPTGDSSVALSPDGRHVAFIADRDGDPMLWVRPLAEMESRILPGTTGATQPFWSPDGRTLGFFADDKLKRIDLGGNRPVVIADAPNARGGTWSRDGTILFAPGVSASIVKVASRGGPTEPVTRAGGDIGPSHRWPHFLPDGRRFLFSSALGTAAANGVYLASLDGAAPVRLLPDEAGGRFAAPGHLLTLRQGALQAYAFDERAGRVGGEPIVVATGLPPAASGVFSTSDTGVLAYRAGAAQLRQLTWVDRQGRVVDTVGAADSDAVSSPELSPDGQSVAVFRQRDSDNDVWVIELARKLERRLTAAPPANSHPLWDPDGKHILYSRLAGSGGPIRQPLSGAGAEPLFADAVQGQAISWTRDRRYLLLRREQAGAGDLVAVSTDPGSREVAVARSPHDETEGQFSPDGRWVAFVSNESGHPEVFVQSFPAGESRTQVSTTGGAQVRWADDGQEIFYVAPDHTLMGVPFQATAAAPALSLPAPLFKVHLASGRNVLGRKPQYAVARDGRFLLNTAVESTASPVVVAVNWTKKLPR